MQRQHLKTIKYNKNGKSSSFYLFVYSARQSKQNEDQLHELLDTRPHWQF